MATGNLHAGPVETLDVSGVKPVDLAYGIHVLEHVSDPVATMASVARLLAPGGRAEFLTPAGDSGGISAYGSAWWMLEDRPMCGSSPRARLRHSPARRVHGH